MRSLLAILFFSVAAYADTNVLVLDGPETNFMRDALKRIDCPFKSIVKLDASALQPDRILILSGKEPSLDVGDGKLIESYLQSGGSVLAIGGGAKWMLNAKLFDASGYYPTGTTIHQSTFDGYHPQRWRTILARCLSTHRQRYRIAHRTRPSRRRRISHAR